MRVNTEMLLFESIKSNSGFCRAGMFQFVLFAMCYLLLFIIIFFFYYLEHLGT